MLPTDAKRRRRLKWHNGMMSKNPSSKVVYFYKKNPGNCASYFFTNLNWMWLAIKYYYSLISRVILNLNRSSQWIKICGNLMRKLNAHNNNLQCYSYWDARRRRPLRLLRLRNSFRWCAFRVYLSHPPERCRIPLSLPRSRLFKLARRPNRVLFGTSILSVSWNTRASID